LSKITVAVDAMGGDIGLAVTIPAAIKALSVNPDLTLILVGIEEQISAVLQQHGNASSDRLKIHHASECVDMDEPPSRSLRGKKDSSMRVSINLVKSGEADACVSAGNTGALMATSRFVLKTLPGIDRPAIISTLPTTSGFTHMLDLGANTDLTAEQLFQFAVMGSALVSAVDNNPAPEIGLLNIGIEDIKGNLQVKSAATLLEKSQLNYVGFVEGDDIFKGTVDVVVCDGFVGNVALKTSEGVAKMITTFMRRAFSKTWLTKLIGIMAKPVLRSFRDSIDPRHYNGASLVGLRGTVIKSHGGADVLAFVNAILEAELEARKNVPQRIGSQVSAALVNEVNT
jgi:phosphate acyltransferase